MDEKYELDMLHSSSARFHDSVCYYREYNGIVDNCTEGENLAHMLMEKPTATVMQLKTHGIITIGGSTAEALEDLYLFEKAARLQVETMGMRIDTKAAAMSEEAADAIHQKVMKNRKRSSVALFNSWW